MPNRLPGPDFALADEVRGDFPVLGRTINGHPLVYLDSANTSQKPVSVVEAMSVHLLEHNANVARAMHTLGAEASAAFEGRAPRSPGSSGPFPTRSCSPRTPPRR